MFGTPSQQVQQSTDEPFIRGVAPVRVCDREQQDALCQIGPQHLWHRIHFDRANCFLMNNDEAICELSQDEFV